MLRILTFVYTILSLLFLKVAAQDGEFNPEDPFGFEGIVADSDSEWIAIMPLPCNEGCLNPASSYYVCFLNSTLLDGRQASQDDCDDYLCQPETYDHLLACLNCIVANGDERPLGYYTNSSLTAQETDSPFNFIPPPVGGYLNATGANGWLRNVTDRCSSIGRPLGSVTATLTASPTTTGPYQTAWTSGQTVIVSIWTGLTEYSELFIPTETAVWWTAESGAVDDSAISSTSISTPASPTSAPSAPTSSGGSQTVSAGGATSSSSPNDALVATPFVPVLLVVPLLGLLAV